MVGDEFEREIEIDELSSIQCYSQTQIKLSEKQLVSCADVVKSLAKEINSSITHFNLLVQLLEYNNVKVTYNTTFASIRNLRNNEDMIKDLILLKTTIVEL